ncbi:MAG: hypothetical protein Q4B87_03095 [Candidatus Saccharibacteria bacterium]|nr:hypothetical protein [Candidatus Saccharibacteria bacterium]
MANQGNKKTLVCVLAGVCIVAIIAAVVVLITKINTSSSQNNSNNSSSANSSDASSTAKVTATELQTTTPAVEIAYGDFEGMKTLSNNIQNGRMTGQIVSIDGLVNHPGSAYSVVQPNADGTTKIGTVFNIDDDSTYPADDTRITIVAKVVEVSPLNFQLVTLKNFVKEK